MKIKEQAIKELEILESMDLLRVYDLILSLKGKRVQMAAREHSPGYMKVRDALRQCKGSLSDDILISREDRV